MYHVQSINNKLNKNVIFVLPNADSKNPIASRGDRTHDHAVKSRALYLLS
jgi:hypothetical protein